ncbi:hypothetical protein KTD55_05780, partial [Burkholderia gladioli]|uniref:hypothetical protein n=1 Tax=Burkholderia gladioli TaxID=28095 RepID=UPI001C245ED8
SGAAARLADAGASSAAASAAPPSMPAATRRAGKRADEHADRREETIVRIENIVGYRARGRNGATFAILRSVSQGCREARRRPYYRVFPRGCDLMYRS